MSKLSPLTQQIRSDAFRRWFEGSWLADDEGQPLVLYHGTRPGNDITQFELPNDYDGIYFTPDPRYAEGFTNELFTDTSAAGGIFPVYLSVKNPLVVTADPGDKAWDDFCYRGYNRQELEAQGYDGAILVEKSTGVIDQVQVYDPTQIKSAIGNAGTFDPTIPDIRYARTDPRYMFAGPQAETSDLELLAQAKHLEKIKVGPDTIWKETGWMRGVDGAWRYEISDKEARLNIGVPQSVEDEIFNRVYHEAVFSCEGKQLIKAVYHENEPDHLATWGFSVEQAADNLIHQLILREYKGIRSVESVLRQPLALPDLLDHPKLYAAYPRLRDMTVTFDPSLGNVWGEFDPGGGITLNPRRTHDEILSILLHECQHAIQEGEGFARGGSVSRRFAERIREHLVNLTLEQQRKVDEWAALNEDLLDAEQATSDTLTYGLMYQSMTRLMSYANREKPSGVLRLIRNETQWVYHDKIRESSVARRFDDLQRRWYDLPKRHKSQARNLFLRDLCAEAAQLLRDVIPADLIKQFKSDERQLNSLIRALERSAVKARQQTRPYRELEAGEKRAERLLDHHAYTSAYEIYKSLAGEIEARNTQTRQFMTDKARRATSPESTADVKKDQAIVVFRDQSGLTVEVPFQSTMTAAGLRRTHTPQPPQALTRAHAQHICDTLMPNWKGKPPIHVVDRITELPMALQKDIWRQRAAEDVRAAFFKDRIYVIAPRLPDRNSLEEVLLHEIIGHYGLRTLLADNLESTLEAIYRDHGQRPEAQSIIERYFQDGGFDASNPEHRQLVAEELMAHLAESGEHKAMTAAQKMEAEVRAGLRQQGFQLPLTHTDLMHLLDGAERVVRRGGLSRPSESDINHLRAKSPSSLQAFRQWFGQSAATDSEGQPRVLYHGTNQAFTEFDHDKAWSSDKAVFLSASPEVASDFALYKTVWSGAHVLPVFLKADRILDVEGNHQDIRDAERQAALPEQEDGEDVYTYALRHGYDAVVFRNVRDTVGPDLGKITDVYAALPGAQIKSALGNSGAYDPVVSDIRFRRAFHGSPHAFSEFSLAAIGTGEGAQAFGWGLYFAGRREVAEYYRDVLAHSTPAGCIAGWDATGLSRTAKELLRDLPMPQAIEYAQTREGRLRGVYDGVADELRLVQAKGRMETGSYLYEVDIPDDDALLDAGKPLAHQPPNVYQAIKDSGVLDKMGLGPWQTCAQMIDGQGLYDFIRQWFVDDDAAWDAIDKTPHDVKTVDQAASDFFNRLGIPGLRYLDANSRASGDGDYNYVIWDDSVVTIAQVHDAENQALLTAPARYSRALHGSPYRFDRLSTRFVGNGQGNHVYGWGLYFTDQVAVAEHYRSIRLPDNTLTDNRGVGWDVTGVSEQAQILLAQTGMDQAITAAQAIASATGDHQLLDNLTTARQRGPVDTEGTLYEVEVPESDALLHWDTPLCRQPDNVKAALLSIGDPYLQQALTETPKPADDGEYWVYLGETYDTEEDALQDHTPENVIRGHRGRLGDTPKAISEALGRAGIPGLTYTGLNGGQHYVIWDDHAMAIEGHLHRIKRTPWHKDFPKVAFSSPLGSAKAHPGYEAAKSGDLEAARELVHDLMTDEALEAIKTLIGDRNPIVVPVIAEEATGANRIPLAYAAYLAKALNLRVETSVVQTVRAGHTDAGADHRLANHAMFDGEVTSGEDYLIVDDTMTMGGTLAGLRGHLEKNRARVIGAATLTGFGESGQLALTDKMRNALRNKHGDALDDYLNETFGFGIDCLTQGEAGHYRKALSLDEIRGRIAAARRDPGDGKTDALIDPPSAPRSPDEAAQRVIDAAPAFLKRREKADLQRWISKALFCYRWDTGHKLAWFDTDAPDGRATLAGAWFESHAQANEPHAQEAERLDLTFSELADRYRQELTEELATQNAESVSTDALIEWAGTMTGQTEDFLSAIGHLDPDIKERADAARQSLTDKAWPFGAMNPTKTEGLAAFMAGSQCVTPTGKPRVMYHATNEDFSAFDPERSSGVAGAGIYLTPEPPKDDRYGVFVMPLFVSLKNPADFTAGDEAISDMAEQLGLKRMSDCTSIPELRQWSADFRQAMIREGYDGAWLAGPEGTRYLVSYHARCVKSALGNNGLFDPKNEDIRYRLTSLEQTLGNRKHRAPSQETVELTRLQTEIPELIIKAYTAYAEGNHDLGEQYDAQAEELMEKLESALCAIEEDGWLDVHTTDQGVEHRANPHHLMAGSSGEEDTEASLEGCLADAYSAYIDPNYWHDRASAVINGRANLENLGADTSNWTDDDILEVMKDAYEAKAEYRNRYRQARAAKDAGNHTSIAPRNEDNQQIAPGL